ncbi:MAG TPA: hypothetical protein VH063_17990 [Gaiellaceae bacterium]|nr:hypothetical protein [Gaiellaceae bacterium]
MRLPGKMLGVPAMLALLLVLAALGTAGPAFSRSTIAPTLYVNYVGTNCIFTIVTDSGANVTSLAPGSYELTLSAEDFVSCGQDLPDFTLSGPGVSIQTPIDAGTGAAADYTVTLQPSATYVAQDLNQPLSRLAFTTLASGTPIVPTAPYSTTGSGKASTSGSSSPIGTAVGKLGAAEPAPLRGTLTGLVSAAGVPRLSFKGKTVTKLESGRYKVSVVDHSRKGGLILQETGRNGTTVAGTTFVGSRTVTVTLKAGQWFFYPTFVGKKNYFIVTSPS